MNKDIGQVYSGTSHRISGHGPRNVGVLTEALKSVDDQQLSDIYGQGQLIHAFEDKMASILGKEGAVFFPSGTMAQQIAMRIWSDDLEIYRVAYHPLCHMEIHEQHGLQILHHIDSVLLGAADRLFTLEDLKAVKQKLSVVLIELPQRELGGLLPSFEEVKAITDYCRSKGIHTHLDGARLWESQAYYKKSLADICALFDSVYVSFYKGIGGLAGAVLAGHEDFLEMSKIWKRRHGGDLISLYPYSVSGDYYYEKRKDKMTIYHEQAVELAALFNQVEGIRTMPQVPMTNMFHVHLLGNKEDLLERLIKAMDQSGLGITPKVYQLNSGGEGFEVSIGDAYGQIGKERLEEFFELLKG